MPKKSNTPQLTSPSSRKALRTPSQRGRASRNKGKNFEREVAAALREIYGAGIRRGWQSRAGDDAADIEGAPWFVECKHHVRVNIRAAWAQIIEAQNGAREKKNPAGNLRPLLIAKDTGRETLAVLRFDDFLALLKAVEQSTSVAAPVETHRTVEIFQLAQPGGN